GVGRAAEAAKERDDSERRVRLERIVHAVGVSAERGVDLAVPRPDGGATVDVRGRPDLVGDRPERDAVTHELRARTGEACCHGHRLARGVRTSVRAHRRATESTVDYITCYHPTVRVRPIPMPDESPESIETLIQRCLNGDEAAWRQIVQQHW